MFYVFFFVFFACVASSYQTDDLTTSINNFSACFFEAVSQDVEHYEKNIFISGMSAHAVLTSLSIGATALSLFEMDLTLDENLKAKLEYRKAIEKINNYKFVNVTLADKLYVKQGLQYTLNPIFEAITYYDFFSKVEAIDFSDPKKAANKINSWVGNETKNKVKDIVSAKDFPQDTILVLINTIYMQGKWDKQFWPLFTTELPFYISETDVTVVEMMVQHNTMNYQKNEALDAQILKLDFEGKDVSMVFFLPNQIDGLEDLEENLEYVDMKALVNSLTPADVTILLPKIKIETYAFLNDDLSELGMDIIFTDFASFEGILLNQAIQLKVDQVIQKTYLDFNEGGASAGVGDVVVDVNTVPLADDVWFTANHPYFFIAINEDGKIDFSGHFTGRNNHHA